MKQLTYLTVLLVASLAASAQSAPPADIYICSDASNCILVSEHHGAYVGLIESGTNHAWDFHIDDWRLEHVKLTGISTATDFDGRHQVVVVEGKPDVIKDGLAYCKARYTVGHESKAHKVVVTWGAQFLTRTGQLVR